MPSNSRTQVMSFHFLDIQGYSPPLPLFFQQLAYYKVKRGIGCFLHLGSNLVIGWVQGGGGERKRGEGSLGINKREGRPPPLSSPFAGAAISADINWRP